MKKTEDIVFSREEKVTGITADGAVEAQWLPYKFVIRSQDTVFDQIMQLFEIVSEAVYQNVSKEIRVLATLD